MKSLLSITNQFFTKFKKELYSLSSISNRDKIVVSVSGGLDSITLLVLLHHLDCFKLIAAHINHNLRIQSNSDEKFVKDLCGELRIPFFTKSLNLSKKNKKLGIEEWGRIERYKFLNTLLEETKANWIMTAHHANDQVETLLMNLSRQSGIGGLKGIAKKREKILRPLLKFTKREIRDFAKINRISFCEDLSNQDIKRTRNFLRHKVLSPWESKMPEVINNISKSVKYFKEWSDGLDLLIKRFVIPELKYQNKKIEIPIVIIDSLPNIVLVRLIQIVTKTENKQLSKHKIAMLVQFIESSSVGKIHVIDNGWRLLKDRKIIKIVDKNYRLENKSVQLLLNEPVFINDYKYEINLSDKKTFNTTTNNSNNENIDWGKIKNSVLEIRKSREGDRFQPLGMRGHQKLSDFFINEKIDCIEKSNQLVLTSDNKIIWVCGKRISNSIKLTSKTEQVAILSRNQIQE